MFRAIFIYLSKLSWAQRLISNWGFAWKMASRFIAGETSRDAMNAVKSLNAKQIIATVDYLGEHTSNPDDARHAAEETVRVFGEIEEAGLYSNVSVKLSAIGLTLDEDLCRDHLRMILDRAMETNNFLRIDMEDSDLTESTVKMYQWAREEGYDNVGIVFQSYLFRTAQDLKDLGKYGVRVRMCKGAYKEPPTVAFQKKKEVDDNLDHCMDILLNAVIKNDYPEISPDGRYPPIPALATHDEARIEYAIKQARLLGIPNAAVEFQMLYGIRRDLQEQLAVQGYPVRVYVPYGTHWYPYFMRRLAERPANLWFFISNYFKD